MVFVDSVFTRIPEQPPKGKPGQLSQELVEQFFDKGYILLENFFDKEKELEPIKNAIDQSVDDLAEGLLKAGKITGNPLLFGVSDVCKEAGHNERLVKLEQQYPGASVLMHKSNGNTKPFRTLWTQEKLLNVMEQLVGPNIASHPVWNLRAKIPQNHFHDVPWHQDGGYREADADNLLLVTAWVPLLDSNKNNGCCEIVPYVHKQNKVGPHKGCYKDTWYIYMEDDDIRSAFGKDPQKDTVVCEVPYGGVLIFNSLIPHRSLPNLSKDIRWSLDLRFHDGSRIEDVGFHRRNALLLRHKDKPNLVPDWTPYEGQRFKLTEETLTDPYDTRLNPEMFAKRWPVVNRNRHTELWDTEVKNRVTKE